MTAAYLRREITFALDRKHIRSHVSVWQGGTRLDDIDLPDDSVTAMASAATCVLSGSYLVGAFVPPPYPDENLDWRADLIPRADTIGLDELAAELGVDLDRDA